MRCGTLSAKIPVIQATIIHKRVATYGVESLRVIPGYESYYASPDGKIYRRVNKSMAVRSEYYLFDEGKVTYYMKLKTKQFGREKERSRLWVSLSVNGNVYQLGVDWLVACTFICRKNKRFWRVLHKDGDYWNNRVENLGWEWRHSTVSGLLDEKEFVIYNKVLDKVGSTAWQRVNEDLMERFRSANSFDLDKPEKRMEILEEWGREFRVC